MADFEGSVNMEGFDGDDESSEETSSENINNSEEESTQTEGEENKVKKPEDNQNQEEEEEVLTDKGTKLDKDPKSAVHQELANAKRETEQYRQFMSDPKAVKRYLAELEEELGDKTGETKQQIQDKAEDEGLITDPSKIETPEDFKSYVKFLTKDLTKAKEDLAKERNDFKVESHDRAINERVVNEIDTLQNKYSVLRPTNSDGTPNPEFDKELEKEIADQYEEIDKDTRTGKYLGKVSILAIAERAIRIRKLGEATGSNNAQTVVVDKRHGAVKTGGGGAISADESKMSASQLIASRMQRASRK
jgi:hypothetical protein